jgi:Tfp pilus assembly protein PilF
MTQRTALGLLVAILCLVGVVYSTHFHNTFQFDDSHTIVDNLYIRDLKNIPLFFTDASVMSTNAANAQYRPITTTLVALEYWLAGGLNPFAFHLVIFSLYLTQLVAMYFFFLKIFARSQQTGLSAKTLSLTGVALYGLHPVSAETVNYIIQQADLTSTLFIILSLVLYTYSSKPRVAYLAPVVLATLSKPPGFMAAPLFSVLFFIEAFALEPQWTFSHLWKCFLAALQRSLPVWLVCVAMGVVLARCTPPTFTPGGTSPFHYIISQPYVIFDYTKTFFWPTDLSADTDWRPVSSITDQTVLIGALFIVGLLASIVWGLHSPERLPIAFGIAWYLIALAPTSIVPLAEVKNDHRMYFPFVGLTMAVLGTANLFGGQKLVTAARWQRGAVVGALTIILVGFCTLTFARNKVWFSQKTLWADVVQKSPNNGRGLMNYGLVLMGEGDYTGARALFERARVHNPYYPNLFVNLGIVYGQLRDQPRAEQHFKRALELAPTSVEVRLFYARYLLVTKNDPIAAKTLFDSVPLTTEVTADMRTLGLELYARTNDAKKLHALIDNTLAIHPEDPHALLYRELLAATNNQALDLDLTVASLDVETADELVNLSLKAFQRKNMLLAISLAESALELDPNNALAYNNKAAALMELKEWKGAKVAAEKALQLSPQLQIARNNLNYILEVISQQPKS